MMEEEPTVKGFPITAHGYNIYADQRVDWLQRSNALGGIGGAPRNDRCEAWIRNAGKSQAIRKDSTNQ